MRQQHLILALVSSIVLTAGCGGAPGGLRGADYDIPVYPEARVTERDSGGFSAGDSFSSLESFDYVSWTLSTDDSMQQVVDYYKEKYPREVDEALADTYADDEELVVNFKAPGMGAEDYVELSIVPGEIAIMQITLRR